MKCKNCGRPLIKRPIPTRTGFGVERYAWRHQITKLGGKKPKCKIAVPVR